MVNKMNQINRRLFFFRIFPLLGVVRSMRPFKRGAPSLEEITVAMGKEIEMIKSGEISPATASVILRGRALQVERIRMILELVKKNGLTFHEEVDS